MSLYAEHQLMMRTRSNHGIWYSNSDTRWRTTSSMDQGFTETCVSYIVYHRKSEVDQALRSKQLCL